MASSSATLFIGARGDTRCSSPSSLALRAVETLELWSERWHQRRALRELSDYALRDLGLSSADIEAEASKPFWRV